MGTVKGGKGEEGAREEGGGGRSGRRKRKLLCKLKQLFCRVSTSHRIPEFFWPHSAELETEASCWKLAPRGLELLPGRPAENPL